MAWIERDEGGCGDCGGDWWLGASWWPIASKATA